MENPISKGVSGKIVIMGTTAFDLGVEVGAFIMPKIWKERNEDIFFKEYYELMKEWLKLQLLLNANLK